MKRSRLLVAVGGISGFIALAAAGADFAGWEGMRVISQEGRPGILRVADLEGDGRDELIVVNTEHSRLDLYRWLPAAERSGAAGPGDRSRPNDLPMPDDFGRQEIPLRHLPHDVVVADWDGQGSRELVVLAAPPNKILVYGLAEGGEWGLCETLDLLPGDFAPRHRPLLLDASVDGVLEVYVGCSDGIQRLRLEPGSRPGWLTPRLRRGREDWWIADLDGDGDGDLVEQTRESDRSLCWYQRVAAGHLAPARVLFDQAIGGAAVLRRGQGADQLLVLDGATEGLLRQYRLARGEPRPLGRQWPLAVDDGRHAIWCGLQLGDRPALAVADRQRPQLLLYPLGPEGWGRQQTFPVVHNVQAMAAPQAEPGTLLLWAEDAAELHVSRWDGSRMSYPRPWPRSSDGRTRRILALGQVGPTTWWVQQVDENCDLYVWPVENDQPACTRFEGLAIGKGGQVRWLGDQRLLVRRDYRDSLEIVTQDGEKTVARPVAYLKQTDVQEFKLFVWGDGMRAARLNDGVLQWLDDGLQPVDQIMLPEGRELADYVVLDQQRGWALEDGGRFIHLMEADETGIPRLKDSVRIRGGLALLHDPVLGLVLISDDQATHLSEGRPDELELGASFDGRRERLSGIKEATIHRIDCLDLDGDGNQEVLLFDDRRHQLTVLGQEEGDFEVRVSWPVFEDEKYPYRDDEPGSTVAEPRVVVAWDADGDGLRDLAMACHDRLIIYLARVEP